MLRFGHPLGRSNRSDDLFRTLNVDKYLHRDVDICMGNEEILGWYNGEKKLSAWSLLVTSIKEWLIAIMRLIFLTITEHSVRLGIIELIKCLKGKTEITIINPSHGY